MPQKHRSPSSESPGRTPSGTRTDSRRGEGSIRRHGANASLDDIAKQASVGPGTLYRPLPYAGRTPTVGVSVGAGKVGCGGTEVLSNDATVEALRTWLLLREIFTSVRIAW